MSKKCACQGGTLTRFIQPIILYSLAKSPDHGYNLVERISQTELWKDMAPDPAGVYRVLREMEERGLIRSQLQQDSKAGIGKRVFELTEDGWQCMQSWIQTLEEYQKGIEQVICNLLDVSDKPSTEPCCCCKSSPTDN